MKKILLGCLLLFLLPLLPVFAQGVTDCDPVIVQGYLDTLQSDRTYLNEMSGYQSLVEYYQTVTYLRRSYEDMTEVPACADDLHQLTIAQFAAYQDSVFYYLMSTYAPGEMDELFLENAVTRVDALSQAIQAEYKRLTEMVEQVMVGTPIGLPEFATPTPDPFAPTAAVPDERLSSGDYYTFAKGGIRLVGIINPYESETTFNDIPEGYHVEALQLEYLCDTSELGEGVSCYGFDVELTGLAFSDGTYAGILMGSGEIIAPVTDEPMFYGTQVPDGDILAGNIYVLVPDGKAIRYIYLLMVAFEEITIPVEEN